MKLFNAIAAAAVISTSFLTAAPAEAFWWGNKETYTPILPGETWKEIYRSPISQQRIYLDTSDVRKTTLFYEARIRVTTSKGGLGNINNTYDQKISVDCQKNSVLYSIREDAKWESDMTNRWNAAVVTAICNPSLVGLSKNW